MLEKLNEKSTFDENFKSICIQYVVEWIYMLVVRVCFDAVADQRGLNYTFNL